MNKYLDQLQFNTKDFSAAMHHYVKNIRIVILLLTLIVGGGLYAFFTMSRTLNPEINITIGVVTTVLPGSTPEDIELLVTAPLEEHIENIDGIDVMTSTSRESVSSIIVQFDDGINSDTASTDLQTAVDLVSDLPGDARDPLVKMVDFEDDPIIRYSIVPRGDVDDVSLNQFATDVADSLEALKIIDRVVLTGSATQEVQVTVTQEKIAALGITPNAIAASVMVATASYPAGLLNSDGAEFGLTIDRSAMTLEDLRNRVIKLGQTQYRLGDIATIAERRAPGSVPAFVTIIANTENPVTKKAITLNIYRVLGTEMNDAAQAVAVASKEMMATPVGEQFSLVTVMNSNEDMERDFSELFTNLSITIVLVFIALLIFVGVRQALVAALSIPLVFMITFSVMLATGISLNSLSIFALLLSLGLLVDVTIVVISAMTSYHRTGRFAPAQTGLLVWKDFSVTLSITTLTTVWAFLPLLLSSGLIGEYIKPIPIIVSTMLVSSVIIGFFVILPLMVWLLDIQIARRVKIFFGVLFTAVLFAMVVKFFGMIGINIQWFLWIIIVPLLALIFFTAGILITGSVRAAVQWFHKHYINVEKYSFGIFQHGIVDLRKIEIAYRRMLTYIIQRGEQKIKVIVIVVLFSLFSFLLVPFGFVKNVFFPEGDGNSVYVAIELPVGTRAQTTLEHTRSLEQELRTVPEVQFVQAQVGIGLDERSIPTSGKGDNSLLFTLRLSDMDKRSILANTVVEHIRTMDSIKNYTDGKIKVASDQTGPPAGADVTLKLFGDDLVVLDGLANDVITYLATQDGVVNVEKSIISGTAKIVFVPNDAAIIDAGLSVANVAQSLRTFGSGVIIQKDVQFDGLYDKRDIVLRSSAYVQRVDDIRGVMVRRADGTQIPIAALGTFTLAPNPTLITHENAQRTISVLASVTDGYNAGEVNANVLAYVKNELNLPTGYSSTTGGANEENNESVMSIMRAMILTFVLIFLTLILLLNSYRKALIVLSVIPLAISGVFIVFALTGLPLSFPSIIGILALFGIVINNSIIIIDQINKNLKEKIDFESAIVEGSASRLEPILMSSLTTMIGLLPITLSDPVWMGLGGAIISGLLFSGIIMLFFIPVMYAMIMGDERE